MAQVVIPEALARLFPGLERKLDVEAETVGAALLALEAIRAGVLDRLCEPGPVIRRHITIFVDGERARIDTAVLPGSEILIIPAVSGGS